ncbi:MAG: nitrate- and nitrite sensing domain-containing protein [Gammaproteobacteria bacterium]|nr:nitrate- and nitrite sensing domain-containing protein [Gammaproteobacteria bacterium]
MSSQSKLSLKAKLVLLLLLPLLALAGIAQYELRKLSAQREQSLNFIELAELGVVSSRLIHELQKERGMTAGFLTSKGAKFADSLVAQRKLTDERLKELKSYLSTFERDKFGSSLNSILDFGASELAKMPDMRAKIDAQGLAVGAAIGYYTGINRSYINLIGQLPKLSSVGALSNAGSAYVSFIQSKERAGIERAVLASAFSKNELSDDMSTRFQKLVSEQDTYMSVFLSLATEQQREYYVATLSGASVAETKRMRELAFQKSQGFNIDAAEWFRVQTDKINLLKNIEDTLSTDLRTSAEKSASNAGVTFNYTLAVVLGCFACCVLFGYFLIRRVMNQLGADPIVLNRVATNIANGNLENSIQVKSQTSTLALMSTMQDNLRQRIESEHNTMSRVLRLRDGLDKLSTPVMVADSTGSITFVNEAMNKYFNQYRHELSQICPSFASNDLTECSIFDFSNDSVSFRTFIESTTECYTDEVTYADRTAQIDVSQTFNETGDHVGYSMELKDITGERAVIQEVANAVRSANEGALSVRIDVGNKDSVYAKLAEGINQLLDVTSLVTGEMSEFVGAIAAGDLSHTINTDLKGDFEVLKRDANQTVHKLSDVMTRVEKIARNVDIASREINAGNLDLSKRTESTAASLQETSSSMEQLTASVTQNADSASRANQMVANARQRAERGGAIVGQAVEAMSGINQSSKQISDIIGVIDEIAFQTNLLALNASVEAARAGDQGRGFAVVASEVRNLAGRSAVAAKEIKELIEDSVLRVQNGTELVGQSGSTLQEIIDQVIEVSEIVGEISNSSKEQSEEISMVSQAITQIDDATQQNAALVEEATAASQSTSSQAGELLKEVGYFSQNPHDDDRSEMKAA